MDVCQRSLNLDGNGTIQVSGESAVDAFQQGAIGVLSTESDKNGMSVFQQVINRNASGEVSGHGRDSGDSGMDIFQRALDQNSIEEISGESNDAALISARVIERQRIEAETANADQIVLVDRLRSELAAAEDKLNVALRELSSAQEVVVFQVRFRVFNG